MSKYTLTINIMSDNLELLDNLLVTLEAVTGDLSEIDRVRFVKREGSLFSRKKHGPTTLQRNLFLDKWILSDTG